MGLPLINGIAYSWADIVCTINGTPVTGITAIKYSDSQEVVNHYGAGRYPIARSKGKVESTASITLTMDEIVAIQTQSTTGRLQDLGFFDVGVSYVPESGVIVHDNIRNCQFKANSRDWTKDSTQQEVALELIVSHIEWNNKGQQ